METVKPAMKTFTTEGIKAMLMDSVFSTPGDIKLKQECKDIIRFLLSERDALEAKVDSLLGELHSLYEELGEKPE